MYNSIKLKLCLLFGIILTCTSCREFIEPSLEKQNVKAIAPAEDIETNVYQMTFWWEENVHALRYRLQVATPSFEATHRLILDTLVVTDKFLYTLDPGKYEWRVRAENGSSHTLFSTRSFIIHPSSLDLQTSQLTGPSHQFYTSNASMQFQWLKLHGAESYRLQVDDKNFIDDQNMILNVQTVNLDYLYTIPLEGTYQLRVRGETATSYSKWSAVRQVTFDSTPPAKVVLNSPSNRQGLAKPFNLTWSAIADAVQYELGVYKNDSTTFYHKSYPQFQSSNLHQFNLGDVAENLVWRVRAIDRAGNKGEWSSYFSFTLQ